LIAVWAWRVVLNHSAFWTLRRSVPLRCLLLPFSHALSRQLLQSNGERGPTGEDLDLLDANAI